MKIFVINVAAATERRAFQNEQGARLGLDLQFVPAVDASGLSDADCQRAADCWTRPITRKDIACYASHRKAWALAAQEPGPSAIIEDDIVFAPEITGTLDRIAERDDPWNRIYDLEYAPGRHVLAKTALWSVADPAIAARFVFKNKIGLGAYALSPRAAAELAARAPLYAMADAWVWTRLWLEPYQIEPAPAVQMVNLATLDDFHSAHVSNREITFNNARYLRRKAIRARLTWEEARRLLGGLGAMEKRDLAFDRERFDISAATAGSQHP